MDTRNSSDTPDEIVVKPRRGRLFLRDRNGSTVIEFSLLAIPFCLLTFAILESCISFAGSQLLANATDSYARQLRTGQIKAAGLTETQVKASICSELEILVASGCPGLKVDLREYTTFAAAAAVKITYTGSGQNKELATSNFGFSPGKSMTKNMLRVFYEWPVMTDFMRSRMSNLKGGKTLHFASAVWQNEPFDD